MVYEAGPVGFGLVRRLRAAGFDADVIAPSKIPALPGAEPKSDRLDGRKLAMFSLKGLLQPVRVPTEQEEADRQVVRLREQLVRKLRSVRQQINKLPGLGDIPILGALFRSRDFIHSQTELVILVTPYLAQPNHGQPALPTDDMVIASDAEAIFLGRMETMYGVGPGGMRGSYNGSVGFVLD